MAPKQQRCRDVGAGILLPLRYVARGEQVVLPAIDIHPGPSPDFLGSLLDETKAGLGPSKLCVDGLPNQINDLAACLRKFAARAVSTDSAQRAPWLHLMKLAVDSNLLRRHLANVALGRGCKLGVFQLYAPDCIRLITVSRSALPSGVAMYSAGHAPPNAGICRRSQRVVHARASNPTGSPLSSTTRCTSATNADT